MSPWRAWQWRRAVRQHYATVRRSRDKEGWRRIDKALDRVLAEVRRAADRMQAERN